jgi:hypothetical protein
VHFLVLSFPGLCSARHGDSFPDQTKGVTAAVTAAHLPSKFLTPKSSVAGGGAPAPSPVISASRPLNLADAAGPPAWLLHLPSSSVTRSRRRVTSERFYHVPLPFLKAGAENTVVLCDEAGGDPSRVDFHTVVVGRRVRRSATRRRWRAATAGQSRGQVRRVRWWVRVHGGTGGV